MRKLIGNLISFSPIIIFYGIFSYYMSWEFMLMMTAGIVGVLDVVGWILWLIVLGQRIANEE